MPYQTQRAVVPSIQPPSHVLLSLKSWLTSIMLGLMLTGFGCAYDEEAAPSALSANEAAAMLIAAPHSYPAVLAVRVTTNTTAFKTNGVQRFGGLTLQESVAFPVGSLTKSMTAVLAGILVQEGVLDWDTHLLDVFPELAATARPEYANVELKDLLSHRGGLFPAISAEQLAELPSLSGTPKQQRQALVNWLLQKPSTSLPGLKTQYSNGDYIAAAAMLERLTWQSYETLLQNRLFTPLGSSVAFGTPGTGNDEPWGHRWEANRWVAISPKDPENQFPDFANPAGGAKLTAEALARYLQMHLRAYQGLTGEIITPATAQMLHTVVQDGFSLGWQEGEDLFGKAIHWHDGSDDTSYYALMALSPSNANAAAVIVTGIKPNTVALMSTVILQTLR